MFKKILTTILLFFQICCNAQNTPSEILLAIKKLNTVGTVLYVAAHPDDENTRLIAWLANEKKLRTGYLSLTRGDGGQNLIGKEQAENLGLIRTQELLAARKTDGGEQFFTRAVDFGYSKNPEETLQIWNKDSILSDMVWTIRKLKPDLIICRFNTDGSGGHGHHTASALLAQEAFDAAADSLIFPNQLQNVQPWQAKRLLWNSYSWSRKPNEIFKGEIKVDVGAYNSLLGKSYGEIAADSRSFHKSQGFGSAKNRGESFEYFKVMKGNKDTTDLFYGLDLTWNSIQGGEKVAQIIEKIVKDYNIENPAKSLPLLILAIKELDNLPTEHWKVQKKIELGKILVAITGLFVEATSTDYMTTPAANLKINFSFINRSKVDMVLEKVIINDYFDTTLTQKMPSNVINQFYTTIRINKNSTFTNPYWLDNPLVSKGLYSVENLSIVGAPENKPALEAAFLVKIGGVKIKIKKPVLYKWVEPSDGEKFRSLEILPPVLVNIEDRAYIFPNNKAQKIKITLQSTKENVSGIIKVAVPQDWTIAKNSIEFTLKNKGEELDLMLTISTTGFTKSGILKISAEVDGKIFNKSITRISYPHIPMQSVLFDAESKLISFDLQTKKSKVGYISGAGDYVAKCIAQMGYEVTILDDNMLTNQDLSKFDAIVTGIRAYNVNDRMKIWYPKLMQYIANGGNLIVQYNTNNWISGLKSDIGPYKFDIGRDRVTKEEAEMNFDKPNHALVNIPNKISATDFDGWVQERGVYFADKEMASEYETIFSCNDPGENQLKGSLIVCKYGKGFFMYSGLSFFRQLPAGVSGAYRLFANMIELK